MNDDDSPAEVRPMLDREPRSAASPCGASLQMAAVGSLTARSRPFEACVARRTDAGSPFRSRQNGESRLMTYEIMISGVGRSGTTALYRIVQKLLRSNGMDPRCVYEPYLWRTGAFEHLDVDDQAFALAFNSTSSLSIEGMYAHAQTPLFARSNPPEHAAFLDHLFGGGGPTLVKIIRGSGRLDAFLAARSDLKIIHIVRNPMDVVNSVLGQFSFFGDEYHPSDKPRFIQEVRKRFGDALAHSAGSEVEWSALWWRYMNQAALETKARFPGRLLAVSQEALKSSPAVFVQRIATFCGLDWHDFDIAEATRTSGSSGGMVKLDAHAIRALKRYDEHYWCHILPSLHCGIDFDASAAARATASKYARPFDAKPSLFPAIPSDLTGPAVAAVLWRQLNGAAARIQEQERVLESLRAQLESLHAQLEPLRAELEPLRAELESLRAELESLRAQLEHSEQAAAKLRKDYRRVKNSWSWRCTRPLRGVSDFLESVSGYRDERQF
jgi:sulfotransferase family protein